VQSWKEQLIEASVLYIMKIQWFFVLVAYLHCSVLLFSFASGTHSHRWLNNDSFPWVFSIAVAYGHWVTDLQ
jgi:hypothetical protein